MNAHRRASREVRYVTVTCVYIGQPLVVAASKNYPLLNGVTALIGECNNTIRFRNHMRLTDLGTNEVVSKSVSLSSFTNHSLLDGVSALIH